VFHVTNGRTDGQTDRQTDKQTDGHHPHIKPLLLQRGHDRQLNAKKTENVLGEQNTTVRHTK